MFSPGNQILLVRYFAAVICLPAVILALGLSNWFDLFDALISVGAFFLAILILFQGYRWWALGFVIIAIIFFPLPHLINLFRYQWTIFDIAVIAYSVLFAFQTTNPYRKGTSFEQHVSSLFPESQFTIVDRTRDISKFSKRIVESDSHPDFVFRNKKTGQTFAVECKYASRWWNQNGTLGIKLRHYQLENYRAFERERKMPVFIAFGIGGIPEKPKEVFFVPLDWIKYDFVWESVIRGGKKAGEV